MTSRAEVEETIKNWLIDQDDHGKFCFLSLDEIMVKYYPNAIDEEEKERLADECADYIKDNVLRDIEYPELPEDVLAWAKTYDNRYWKAVEMFNKYKRYKEQLINALKLIVRKVNRTEVNESTGLTTDMQRMIMTSLIMAMLNIKINFEDMEESFDNVVLPSVNEFKVIRDGACQDVKHAGISNKRGICGVSRPALPEEIGVSIDSFVGGSKDDPKSKEVQDEAAQVRHEFGKERKRSQDTKRQKTGLRAGARRWTFR